MDSLDPEESYELLNHLGTGGFAHTYHARVLDEELVEDYGTNEVALKVPLNKKKERVLRRELEINIALHMQMRQMEHNHIVRYLGFNFFKSQAVMVMEFVKTGSLRDRLGGIGRQEPIAVEEVVKIGIGILKGLEVIHAARVFHRDIKPENILMDGSIPKIADLGIARMLESNELASTATGTIFYMSPEILSDEGATFTSDIWSVGVTLYEMLAGRLPFGEAKTPIGTTVDLIRRADPQPLSEGAENMPRGLTDIVNQALRRKPEDRYQSSTEMYQDLERFISGEEDQIDKEIKSITGVINDGGDDDEVEARLRTLVEGYPDDTRAYQELGSFLNRNHRYGEAVVVLREGLKIDSMNVNLHWYMALACQRSGKRTAASQHLKKVISLDSDMSLQKYAASLLRQLEQDRK